MATRLKVNRDAFLKAIDAAISDEEQYLAEVKAKREAFDWREHYRPWVEQLTAALADPKTDEESFDNLAYSGKPKKPGYMEGNRRSRGNDRSYLEDLMDLRETVKMAEETFTVSTDDHQVSQIMRAARRQAAQQSA